MKPDFSRFDLKNSALLRGWKVAPTTNSPRSESEQRYFLGSTELRIEPHYFESEDDHQKFLTSTRKYTSMRLGDPIESGKPKNFGGTWALLLHVKPYSSWLWVYAHPGKPGLSGSQADRFLMEIAKELTARTKR